MNTTSKTSNITCNELFEIFYKIGGKINCNYEKKNITLSPQNIICYIDKNEIKELDKFVFIMSTASNTNFTNEYYKENKINFRRLHHYQDNNSKSLTIEFNNSNK